MSWTITLIAAAVLAVVVLVCGWRGAQPPNFKRGPRLFPYRFVMLIGSALFLGLLVHMAHLAGFVPPPRAF